MAFAELLETVGSFGRFQVIHVALLAWPVLMMAGHNLLQNFVAMVPSHRCRLPGDSPSLSPANSSRQSPGNLTGKVGASPPPQELPMSLLPVFTPLDGEGRPERCRVFAEPQWQFLDPNVSRRDGSPDTRPCADGWLYAGNLTSIVTECPAMGFEEILNDIGGLGKFQFQYIFMSIFPALTMPSHNLLQNFVAAVPSHRCRLPGDSPSLSPANSSWQSPGNLTGKVGASFPPPQELPLSSSSLPVFTPLDGEGLPERCRVFAEPQWQFLDPNVSRRDGSPDTRPCTDGWIYAGNLTSIVTEWDLVCDHKSLKQLSQSIYMAGVLTGAIIMGQLSDRFGRRPILLWSHLQMAASGTCGSFSSSFPLFCFWRFMCGVALSGIILNSYSLMVEWIPTRVRTGVMTVSNYSYTFGQILLAGLAFAVKDWRWLQFTVSVPFFVYFLYSWWFPESARWLIMNNKVPEAVTQLKRVARLNGREAEGSKLTVAIVKSHMEKELLKTKAVYGVSDLFHTPVMRRTACCTMIVWFSVSFAYYGLSIDLQGFGVNIYLIQVIFGAVDIPAKLVGVATMSLIGRRFTQGWSLILAGTIILINIFVPQEHGSLRTAFAAIGKGCLAAAFSCAYLHAGELYPTVIRQTGMGLVSSMARIGAMVAPMVKVLGDSVSFLPMVIYGGVALLAGVVAFFLRETLNVPLPDTVEEVESGGNEQTQTETETDLKKEEIALRDMPSPSLMTQTI